MITQQEKQASAILLNYRSIDKCDIQALGRVEVYQHRFKDNDHILKKSVELQSYTFDELELFDDACALANPNILQILSQRTLSQTSHELFLEDVNVTLAEEIAARKKRLKPFRDTEILTIAVSILNALIAFQENYLPHRQITPHTIFKTMQGDYKIIHPLAIGSRVPTYNKILNEGSLKLYRYIPPEAKYHLPKGQEPITCDPFKEDVYSLGISLIEACALDASDSDPRVKLKEIKTVYSFPLVNLLEKIIDNNHLIRPQPSEALDWIRTHNIHEKVIEWLSISMSEYSESPQLSTGIPLSTIKRMSPACQLSSGATLEQEFISPLGIQDGGLDLEFITETDRKINEIRDILHTSLKPSPKKK